MPLLNYTTTTEAEDNIAKIQKTLVKHGARAVMTEYDDTGYVVAVSFRIRIGEQEIPFRLPSDWRPVQKVLERQKTNSGRRVKHTQDQAIKVSWCIIKDWVEAQMAIIETEMVKMEQVFLPYAVTKTGETVYEKIQSSGFLLDDGK